MRKDPFFEEEGGGSGTAVEEAPASEPTAESEDAGTDAPADGEPGSDEAAN